MAGFGAAYRLHAEGITPVMYDKNDYHGGHTASFRYDSGFLFDVGPHISFTKDPRIQELFADSVRPAVSRPLQINLNNYWRGHWPQHPVQLHLHGLPEDVVVKVIADFVKERQTPERPIKNYADWLLTSFGRTFAELFPMQYTRKYHTTTADNMSTDWLGPRIYRPSLEEVLRGALSPHPRHVHYITHFRYPSEGGFVSYLKKFVPLGNLNLNHELVSVDPRAAPASLFERPRGALRRADLFCTAAGSRSHDRGRTARCPRCRRRLACSTCVLVNVGVNREDLSRAHMTYFYDEDICFTRLGFPHMLSASNASPGTGSIQAEVYFSEKYKPFTGSPDDWIEPVIRDLRRCGFLREDDRLLCSRAMLLPYANIIFDLDRAAALKTVHGYLDDLGIAYCGRYGDWGYMWTDESFKSGELAAERAISVRARPQGAQVPVGC